MSVNIYQKNSFHLKLGDFFPANEACTKETKVIFHNKVAPLTFS